MASSAITATNVPAMQRSAASAKLSRDFSAPGATIREGKLLNGAQTVDDLKAWAESLNV